MGTTKENSSMYNSFSAWKLVWVVTAPKYVPMGIVSAASFLIFNPNNRIQWIVTPDANGLLETLLPDWMRGNSDILVDRSNCESAVEASRRLRVRISEYVSGDFAVVDADILCVKKLDLSLEEVTIIGACPNRENNGCWKEDFNNTFSRRWFQKVGWPWTFDSGRPFLNAGLVFYKDSALCRTFGTYWEKNRKEFLAKTGQYYDQPAFNKTAQDTNFVTVLNTKYNAPVYTLPQLARGASCYHYYVSGADEQFFTSTALGFLAEQLRDSRSLSEVTVREVLARQEPFVGIGARPLQYKLAGQWRPYIERLVRDRWNSLRRRFLR